MPIPVDPIDFGVWEKIFSIAGTAAASIIAAVSFVAKRWSSMEDRLSEQDRRIMVIEENYVSKESLREVLDDLQRDVTREISVGFNRAHERIDQLFTQFGAHRRIHERDERDGQNR